MYNATQTGIKELLKMCEGKKYNVIYADPAWQYGSKHYQDGERDFKKLETIYHTMTIPQIKELPIKEITDKNCACFMWVTDSHLKEGITSNGIVGI